MGTFDSVVPQQAELKGRMDNNSFPRQFSQSKGLRIYEATLRKPDDATEHITIMVPGGLVIPPEMVAVHAEARENAAKAIALNRGKPLRYGLLDRRGELQGCGSFGRDDDAESIATLSGLFLEMGYRLGIEIPKDVTEDQPPIRTLGGRNV